MRDLGLLARVVACTKYCADVCPEVADGSRLIVSDSWTAQSEQILAAKPDLVLASVPYQLEAVAEILKAGIRFLGLAPQTLADIYADIALIAGIMGVPERGEQVVSTMQGAIEDVRVAVPRRWQSTTRLLRRVGQADHRLATLGGRVDRVRRRRRSSANPDKTVAAEAVAQAQPDVLLAAWCGAGDRVPLEKIVEQAKLERPPSRPSATGVLHQRRIAQHSRHQPDRRTARHRLGTASRSIS